MKNKFFKLLTTFLTTSIMLLTACSGAGKSSSKDDLELLYFGKPIPETVEPAPQMLKTNRALRAQFPYQYNADDVDPIETDSDDDVYEVTYFDGVTLEAHVRNTNRLSFVDAVIYSAATDMKYVFTDGNGDYRVETSTVLSDGVWTTKLHFQLIRWDLIAVATRECTFNTYLEIEEINFLNLAGAVTGTNIAENDIKRVDIHATDNEESNSHAWSEWEYRGPTCEQYRGRYHRCSICGKEHFETVFDYSTPNLETDAPLGHIYNGDWEIIHTSPTVLCASDLFQSVGTCSRCNKVISQNLSSVKFISDFSYDLIIPNGIKTIETHTFTYFNYLKTVTFPSSIEFIGEGAFQECNNLTDVYFEGSVPPKVGDILFDPIWREDTNPFKIHVPTNALVAYQNINNAYWQDFGVPRLVADVVVSE